MVAGDMRSTSCDPAVDDIAPSGRWMRCHLTNDVKAL